MNESLPLATGRVSGHGPWPLRLLHRITETLALLGGGLLVLLIGMSLVSIIGRKLFAAPVRGDIELMEMGAAVAIAAFLPLCELRGLHLRVDAFTNWLPTILRQLLDSLTHLLLGAVALLLAWRTGLQMLDSRTYGDISTLLSVPLWIPLALLLPSLILLAACALARIFYLYFPAGDHR